MVRLRRMAPSPALNQQPHHPMKLALSIVIGINLTVWGLVLVAYLQTP